MKNYQDTYDFKTFYEWYQNTILEANSITILDYFHPQVPDNNTFNLKTLEVKTFTIHPDLPDRTWLPWGIVIAGLLHEKISLYKYRFVQPPLIDEALHRAITFSTMHFFMHCEAQYLRQLLLSHYHSTMSTLYYDLPFTSYSRSSIGSSRKPHDILVIPAVPDNYHEIHKILTNPIHPPPSPPAEGDSEPPAGNGHAKRTEVTAPPK